MPTWALGTMIPPFLRDLRWAYKNAYKEDAKIGTPQQEALAAMFREPTTKADFIKMLRDEEKSYSARKGKAAAAKADGPAEKAKYDEGTRKCVDIINGLLDEWEALEARGEHPT